MSYVPATTDHIVMLPPPPRPAVGPIPALQVYLLGVEDFDAVMALQRRLVYEVSGDRDSACLLLCEHPPQVSIGREGSRAHLDFDFDELKARGWPIRWVNRGGGVMLHLPGQLAVYPVFPLDRLGLNPREFQDYLATAVCQALSTLDIPVMSRVPVGLMSDDRYVAQFGLAVRDWVSYFGFVVNVNPDLRPFRRLRVDFLKAGMTSVQRLTRLPVRPASIRLRLVDAIQATFGFERLSVFHGHPTLSRKAPNNAVATSSR